MKIWTGYDSEHSYRLVMIGHFADETKARAAAQKFERLRVAAESELPEQGWDTVDTRFSEAMRRVLDDLNLYDLNSADVENFSYEHSLSVTGTELRLATDEGQVQGFLKVLIDGGAKVEVYSGHHWTDEGGPRGEQEEHDSADPGED